MKLITFTYTKADGKVSEREVIEISQPSTLLSGLDVTEMYSGDFAEFANDYKELLDEQNRQRMELMQVYALKHAFRQFKPEGMTNVVVQHV